MLYHSILTGIFKEGNGDLRRPFSFLFSRDLITRHPLSNCFIYHLIQDPVCHIRF